MPSRWRLAANTNADFFLVISLKKKKIKIGYTTPSKPDA